MTALSVNIDHIATVRQARKNEQPDPVKAALICEKAGAEGITFHLRRDRRHIQDEDVMRLRKNIRNKLNMEMAAVPEMVRIAKKNRVEQVTLVPEKREELTTEGGLNVYKQRRRLKGIIQNLKSKGIFVSLFIDPELEQVKVSSQIDADAIEIHTGAYCNAKGRKRKEELEKIDKAAKLAETLRLKIFAGHGLDYKNVSNIAALPLIEELNIGYSIISLAVFSGLETAVKDMLKIVR